MTTSLKHPTTGTTASAPPKPNQIEEQLNILNDSLVRLDARLRSLSGCLDPVLRAEVIEKSGEEQPASILVPRAEVIRNARWKVDDLVERVEDLLNRVEA